MKSVDKQASYKGLTGLCLIKLSVRNEHDPSVEECFDDEKGEKRSIVWKMLHQSSWGRAVINSRAKRLLKSTRWYTWSPWQRVGKLTINTLPLVHQRPSLNIRICSTRPKFRECPFCCSLPVAMATTRLIRTSCCQSVRVS